MIANSVDSVALLFIFITPPFMPQIPLVVTVVSIDDNIETMNETTANITALLQSAALGDRRNVDALMEAIYDDLHRLAASIFAV